MNDNDNARIDARIARALTDCADIDPERWKTISGTPGRMREVAAALESPAPEPQACDMMRPGRAYEPNDWCRVHQKRFDEHAPPPSGERDPRYISPELSAWIEETPQASAAQPAAAAPVTRYASNGRGGDMVPTPNGKWVQYAEWREQHARAEALAAERERTQQSYARTSEYSCNLQRIIGAHCRGMISEELAAKSPHLAALLNEHAITTERECERMREELRQRTSERDAYSAQWDDLARTIAELTRERDEARTGSAMRLKRLGEVLDERDEARAEAERRYAPGQCGDVYRNGVVMVKPAPCDWSKK